MCQLVSEQTQGNRITRKMPVRRRTGMGLALFLLVLFEFWLNGESGGGEDGQGQHPSGQTAEHDGLVEPVDAAFE